jgi:hypothetical protein
MLRKALMRRSEGRRSRHEELVLYKRNNYEKNEFHIKRNVSKSMSDGKDFYCLNITYEKIFNLWRSLQILKLATVFSPHFPSFPHSKFAS